MITRAVFLNLKPGCHDELTRILEREVLALFRKNSDFRGLVAFLNGNTALSLTFWNRRKSAEADGWSAFKELAALSRVSWGTPSVQALDLPSHVVEKIVGPENLPGSTPELKILRVSDSVFQDIARIAHAAPELPPT